MTIQIDSRRLVGDVKCYHCGHISGQIIGYKDQPLKVENFVPRPGYTGAELRPGIRMRCERCNGPVYLEDTGTSGITDIEAAAARKRAAAGAAKRRAAAAAEDIEAA